jgi:CO dehydrogenase/acetyl-CoA synthase alpha subunit
MEDMEKHCAAIERCNQRGGRMLSIVDLIEAGTISRDLTA